MDPDPCVENRNSTDCKFCSILTTEQCSQLSTPSYKIKKEKREAKKDFTATPNKYNMDSASVSVIGAVDGHGHCSLLVLVFLLRRSRKRWRKRKLQLPRPSHPQTDLQNLVQTAGFSHQNP